ncbi:MAG: enoyl-CoA hydratase/isomerase family protein [Acidobacteria bacterium]|nr:enoyl-CoA hydratase/isomerase family protein [Acidobacteriota bacterium]
MDVEYKDGVAIARMQLGKANAMGANFLAGLNQILDQLQERPAGCVVLTGYDRFFSAGLNLLELWEYDRVQLSQFLSQFNSTFMRFMKIPQVVISAINGNAIAGGAILAQTTDYRIMAKGDIRIGVNEIQVGIPFPRQVLEIIKDKLPVTSHFDAIYRGVLFSPEEALKVGFVDEICDLEKLEQRAFSLAKEMASKHFGALACIKRDMSASRLEKLEMLGRLGDSDFLNIWFSEDTRARMGTIVDSLKSKKR